MADINGLIGAAAAKYGLDPAMLTKQFSVESGLNPNATSPKGARGIAQVMPKTAMGMGYNPDELYKPEVSIDAGAKYMRQKLDEVKRMNPNLSGVALQNAALAAYNAGAGGASNYIKSGDVSTLPKETQGYIAKITGEKKMQSAQVKDSVYQAYLSGKMTPEDASKFKQLIDDKMVTPPKKFAKAFSVKPFKQSVIDAYSSGKMLPEDRVKFEDAANSNPNLLPKGVTIGALQANPPAEKGLLDKATEGAVDVAQTIGRGALGLGETALMMGTGAVAAPIGIAKGVAQDITGTLPAGKTAQQVAEEQAQALTYMPRSDAAKPTLAALGEAAPALESLNAVAPMLGELGALSSAAKGAQQVAAAKTAPVAARAAEIAAPVIQKAEAVADSAVARALKAGQSVKSAAGKVSEFVSPSQSTVPARYGSAGAAATEAAAQRQARAELLGFTDDAALTEGQITRDLPTQAFEGEIAKQEIGAPINARYTAQNEKIGQVLDNFIESTGKAEPTINDVGRKVVDVLGAGAETAKNKVRALYKAADESGETLQQVELKDLINHINESSSSFSLAPILGATKKELIRLGAAAEDEVGNLIALPVTLREGENLRKFIGSGAGNEPTNIRQASIMKGLYDDGTASAGGKLFQEARAARAKFAKDFENKAVVARLLSTKRGMDDRTVALEDVFKKTVLDGSKEDLQHLRKVLHTKAGEDGRQAWRELQGATIEHIKEQATTAAKGEGAGAQMISSAALKKQIDSLDKTGKLDFIFGKQGAQSMRDLRDIALDVKQFIPGAYNSSGTGAVIAKMVMDSAVTGVVSGVPLPIATAIKSAIQYAKGRETRKRVTESLNYSKKF